MKAKEVIEDIVNPKRVWSRSEVLSKPNPIPMKNGVYAWFFKSIPPKVPLEGCKSYDDKALLYVGISPNNKKIVRI